MRHTVILAHPDPESFNSAVAKTYARAVEALGDQAVVRDLYALGFDPLLRASELPWRPNYAPGADVVAERTQLAATDVFVFVYPLWFNAPPAMLKGFVERVLGTGFGYGPDKVGTRPLLTGKQLLTISTSGAPEAWVDQTGAVRRLRADFDDHLAAVCGLTVLDHLNLSGVTPGIRPDAGLALLRQVDALVSRLFAHVA